MNFDKFDPVAVTGLTLVEWLWKQPNATDLRILNTGDILAICNPKTNELYMLDDKNGEPKSPERTSRGEPG